MTNAEIRYFMEKRRIQYEKNRLNKIHNDATLDKRRYTNIKCKF